MLLNYADDDGIDFLKTAMGWNVAPTALGARITSEIVALVRTGAVRPVVGAVGNFEDLPMLIDAMGKRQTTGRTIITVAVN